MFSLIILPNYKKFMDTGIGGTLKILFSKYYERTRFPIKNVESREFGAGWRNKIDRRHMTFFTEEELRHFLVSETPLYISHSTAYYAKPSAPMKEKGWKGSDLVFDLDSEEATSEALDSVHQDALELLDLLKEEFGVRDYLFVFSGNRGFHIHVRDEEYLSLDSNARRKVVAYVAGTSFDYKQLFYNKEGMLLGPKPTDQGYGGRFARKVVELLMDNPKFLYRNMTEEQRNKFIEGINQGIWSKFPKPDVLERLSKVLPYLELHTIAADGAVTYDVSKLIRVPNSLHGSTGFRVLPMRDPERFSIQKAFAFSEEQVSVEYLETFSMNTLLGKLEGVKGRLARVPLYEAVFLCCQRKAKLKP